MPPFNMPLPQDTGYMPYAEYTPSQSFTMPSYTPTSAVPEFGTSTYANAATSPDIFSMEGMFGKTGWAPHGINALNGLMQGFIGMKQYGLGKKQLAESKRQFQMNYDAQTKLTNSQLRDRQRARVASNPGAYESVDSYMTNNGI